MPAGIVQEVATNPERLIQTIQGLYTGAPRPGNGDGVVVDGNSSPYFVPHPDAHRVDYRGPHGERLS